MKEFYKNMNNINNKSENEENSKEIYFGIYKNLGLLGVCNNPLEGFPDFKTCSDYMRMNYLPLYTKIKNILIANEQKNTENFPKNYDDEEKENKYTCDDLFAIFLVEMSQKVIPSFYKLILIFIRFYRECMNKLGWEILYQFKDLEDESTYLDYCTIKCGEYLPQISNDYIKHFLVKKCPDFDNNIAVVLVSHFCHWLYKKNYTHMRVNLIKNEI